MKIAFIGDQPGKVHYNRFCSMSKYMDIKFNFFTVKKKNLQNICSKYDGVYYASYVMYKKCPLNHPRIYGSATSWKCMFGSDHSKDMRILDKFYKISANNLSLANELKKHREDVAYIPNGVEHDFFTPDSVGLHDPIRVGWVGNRDRAEKNFHILHKVRREHPGIQWEIMATSKSDSAHKLRTRRQMRDFYRTLDYFLVVSSYEGTPNPALEAASCGVPLVATKVGNMPELIQDGVNGFLVVSSPKDVVDRLRHLPNERKHLEMRRAIRGDIENGWTWDLMASKFESFFNNSEL